MIKQVFAGHKRRYGSRRIVAELKKQGHEVGWHQVWTLMKQAGLQPIQPHQRPGPAKSFVPRTTDSTHGKGYWPNLLLDQPLLQGP
ncbi:IS3 family transposase [Spirosoma soli]|uniref:IS3 family transposase n=1 Tax=Spirosoma soli TaxID=1770529 RepID=A0ABW5ME73_9BACT